MILEEYLNKINAHKAEIDSIGELSMDVLQRINDKFRLELNFHSNKMEGNSLTKAETQSVMLNNITVSGKPLKDILEIQGHNAVIQDIQKMARGDMNITENKIKNIHSGIMFEVEQDKKNQIGKWKNTKNYLYNYRGERMDFTAPEDVAVEMNTLVNWLNNELISFEKRKNLLSILQISAEFHLRIVSIHPFYDGNGRTARILMNLILTRYGFPPIIIKENEVDAYSQYLAHAQEYEKNPLPFYEFLASLLVRSMELYLRGARGEDIRDLDDFDKELRLMEINLLNDKKKEVEQTPELIREVFSQSIFPLTKILHTRLNKFNAYFYISKMEIVIDGFTNSGWNSDFETFMQPHLKNWNNYNEIILEYLWQDFKQEEVSKIRNQTRIIFRFEPFKYTVSYSATAVEIQELSAKYYSQQLNKSEIEKIVNYFSIQILKSIKDEYEVCTGKKL